jgi:hypothetical protein
LRSSVVNAFLQPPEIRNVDYKTLKGPEQEDLAKLRGLIYNEINSVILEPLKRRSSYGDTFRFGDGIVRRGYPGILIQSMDFQEIAAWLAMRSAQANFPCPKCLVPKDQLACLTRRFTQRTTATMRAVLQKAQGMRTKKDKEKVLRDSGLHDVKVPHLTLALNLTHALDCSKSCGTSNAPIHTRPCHMIRCIGMRAENLAAIYGYS